MNSIDFVTVNLINPDFFSPRESEIAVMLVRGHPMKYIANLLGISPSTVNSHCLSIYRKLDISYTAKQVRIFALHMMVIKQIITISYTQ